MLLSKAFLNYRLLFINTNLKYIRNANVSLRQYSAISETKTELTSSDTDVDTLSNFYLPEPPMAPEILPVVQCLNHLGEATFASLGLNSYWPTGWIQAGYEFLHVQCGLPWWGAIVTSAVLLRTIMAPLSYKIRKLTVMNTAISPKLMELERKRQAATLSNDILTLSKVVLERNTIIESNNFSPMKMVGLQFLQFPPFIVIMLGLRKMASLPVASMHTGGFLWFPDLTMSDPYYLLPTLTMLSLLAQLELGADINKSSTFQGKSKWIIRCIPLIGLAFTCNFPSALTLYWFSSSIISIFIVGVMKLPYFKSKISTPKLNLIAPVVTDKSSGFLKQWRNSATENKTTQRIKKMESTDNENWINAGKEAIPKTYLYDPTKVKVT